MSDNAYLIIAILSSVIFIIIGTILVYLSVKYIVTSSYGFILLSFILFFAAGYSLYKFFNHNKRIKENRKIIK